MTTLRTSTQWSEFLKQFSTEGGEGDSPGRPGASEEHLSAAERRLRIQLPPSYRAFLATSNGWQNASREVPVLKPVQKIRWFRREHPEWVQAYMMEGIGALLPAEQDYFNYGDESSGDFDPKHPAQTLCISEVGDSAVLLLNPMVIWPDGEWEGWFFANWVPGAIRYRSFGDWMRHEYCQRFGDTFQHSTVPGELPTVYIDGPAKPNRRIRPREEILPLEVLPKYLASKTKARRMKAVRQLARLGGQPAIAALLRALKEDSDQYVRCEAAECLGKMRAVEAIEPLIEIANSEKFETSSAVEALGFFDDERSARFLLKLVEDDGLSAGVATYALARRNDPRGVPVLVEQLLSATGNTAGRMIAQFEEPGFLALEPLVSHESTEIRRRALVGVFDVAYIAKDKEVKIRAQELLRQCLAKETDDELQRILEVSIEVVCPRKI